MIQVSIEEVHPGMVLARSILGERGNLLLSQGFVLNNEVIAKCRKMELNGFWVYQEGVDVIPEILIQEQLELQALGTLQKHAELLKSAGDMKNMTVASVRGFLADASRFKNIIAVSQAKSLVSEIIETLLAREPLMVNLTSMRSKSGYLFQHSLDVTITSILLAQRLRFPIKDIEELALGTFLMDFGMILLSESVFNKKGPLSAEEKELMREHPSMGYAILKENEGIAINTAHVAYQHHENQDGTGYPRGLKGRNELPRKVISTETGFIHRYAEVAAVADTYISLLAPRPGTFLPKSPEMAMRDLIMLAGTRLNTPIVDLMISMIPVFPVGSRITVTEDPKYRTMGYSGVVAQVHPENKERPIIILLFDRNHQKIKPMKFDLAENLYIKIQFAPL